MSIIGTIIIGLLVGIVARWVKPGEHPMSLAMTTILGIGGSLLATYGGQGLGLYEAGQTAGFIGAVLGAIVLLVVFNYLKKS